MLRRALAGTIVCALLALTVRAQETPGPIVPDGPMTVGVLERPGSGGVNEYVLKNFPLPPTEVSAGDPVMDITAFAVSASQPGADISTSNTGWIAQPLDAHAWEEPMGGPGSDRYTWRQFTGLAFDEVFLPTDPCHGFFFDYVRASDAAGDVYRYLLPVDPCRPEQFLAGFMFNSPIASRFVVAGPADYTQFAGDPNAAFAPGILTVSGETQVVPEPTALALLLLLAATGGPSVIRLRRLVHHLSGRIPKRL